MGRVDRLRTLMAQQHVEAMLIGKAENRRPRTGFTGSAGFVLITASEALLLVDFRYVEQAAAQAPGFEVVKADRQFIDALAELVPARAPSRRGVGEGRPPL